MRRLVPVLVLVLLVAATVALLGWPGVAGPPDGSTPPTSASLPPAPATPPPAMTFPGPEYDPEAVHSPTREATQSKLWHHAGAWWAVLVHGTSGELRIHRLDPTVPEWVDSRVAVDPRDNAVADVLPVGDAVYVATVGPGTTSLAHAGRVSRFDFDPATGWYRPAADFPVAITPHGARSLTLAIDGDERLWIGAVVDDRLLVAHSTDSHRRWAAPFPLPGAPGEQRIGQAVLATIDGDVAVAWTTPDQDGLFLARHRAGGWSESRFDIQGVRGVTGHLNVRTVPGPAGTRLLFTVGTRLDEVRNEDGPLVVLVVVEPDGSWRTHLAGRIADRHSRPVLAVDIEHDRLYFIASAPAGDDASGIYVKETSLSNIVFPAGPGFPLIVPPDSPGADDPTTTRQAVGKDSGLVILGSDDVAGGYRTALVTLAGSVPGGPAPAMPPALTIAHDTFDPLDAEAGMPPAWRTPGLSAGAAADLVPGLGGLTAQLRTGPDGARARACRPFSVLDTGRLRVDATIRLGALGSSDAAMELSGDAGEVAGGRFDNDGVLAYDHGATRVKTDVPFRPDVWYRSRLEVDLDGRTYSWDLSHMATGAPIFSVADVPWVSPDATDVDELCLETSHGAAGITLEFDDVVLERR